MSGISDDVNFEENFSQTSIVMEPRTAGLINGGITDPTLVEKMKIQTLKLLASEFLSGAAYEEILKIHDHDYEAMRAFIMGPYCVGKKFFLCAIEHIATLSTPSGANQLLEIGAAEPNEHSCVIAFNAYKNHPEKFQIVLKKVEENQEIPDRSYEFFLRPEKVKLKQELTQSEINTFRLAMMDIFEKKKLGRFCRAMQSSDEFRIGVIFERGTAKSGYSTVDDDSQAGNAFLSFRKPDFAFGDRSSRLIMINSVALSKFSRSECLKAVGELLCADIDACRNPVALSLSEFNTPDISNLLKNFNIPGVSSIEMRKLIWKKDGANRHTGIVGSNSRKGCITDDASWKDDMPPNWNTVGVNLTYTTIDGVRENIGLKLGKVLMQCNSNLNLTIALLKHFKVIPDDSN